MTKKEEIRPIYRRLKGYMAKMPEGFVPQAVWARYNDTLDELSKVTDEDYNFHKITPKPSGYGSGYESIHGRDIIPILSGLINELTGKYFSDEEADTSSDGGITINQHQQQSMTIQFALLEMQESVIKKSDKFKEGTNEKSFLDKVKNGLKGVKSWSDLLTSVLNSGKEFGLSAKEILEILF